MDQQFSLFSATERPPAQTNDLFIALFPDDSAAGDIVKMRNELESTHGSLGHLVRVDRLHVTLAYLNRHAEIPSSLVDRISRACEIAARTPAFSVAFDQVRSFKGRPGNLPLVLAGEHPLELMKFQRNLLNELAKQRCPIGKNPRFNPHLTLLYGPKKIQWQVRPIEWTVGEIVLVQSVLGQTKHIHLARWKLDPARKGDA